MYRIFLISNIMFITEYYCIDDDRIHHYGFNVSYGLQKFNFFLY